MTKTQTKQIKVAKQCLETGTLNIGGLRAELWMNVGAFIQGLGFNFKTNNYFFKHMQNNKNKKVGGKCASYDLARLGRRVGVVGFVAVMVAVGFM